MIDYQIVVASKGRPDNVAGMLKIFPDASFCVDEREEEDYGPVVPEGQLVLHSPTKSLGEVRNWVCDNYTETCVIHIDDDLDHVVAKVGKKCRKITDPIAIQKLVENMVCLSTDLDLEMFVFSKESPAYPVRPYKPFKLCPFPYGVVGQINRTHRWDDDLRWGEDVDLTLKYMMTSRIVLCDNRHFFNFGGGVGAGKGGLQGMRTEDGWIDAQALLNKRWGPYQRNGLTNKGGYANYNLVKRIRDTPTR